MRSRPTCSSNTRILIVEGTAGIGKTTLLTKLLRRYAGTERPRTVLHLTQAHTFGPLVPGDDAGTLTAEQNLAHLEDLGEMLAWHVHALAHETKPKFFGLLDTLHLTHCHRPGVLQFDDVRAFDEWLAHRGARLLLLRAQPQTLWERCIVARRGSDFLRYAQRFGQTEEQVHAYFLQEQDQILQLSERSAMPRLQLEVEDPELEATAWAWWMGP
jgi:hypothetical protein